MDLSAIRVRYAKAFFSLAKEKNMLETFKTDIENVLNVCKQSAEFVHLLESPVISTSKKAELITKIFKAEVNPFTLNFLLLILQNKREEYILAAYQFSKLIKSMPSSEFLPDAQFMLSDCYYELSPDYTLDQQYTKKAIEEFQVFIDFYPLNARAADAESKIKELNDKLARKEYEDARLYDKMDYYLAAFKYYDSVMEVYHDTQYAPLALYNKINLLVDRKKNSEALAESQKFLQKYPNDKNFNDVQKIEKSLESKLSVKP